MTSRPWLLRVSAVVMAAGAAGWIFNAWQARSYPTLIGMGLIVAGATYAGLRNQIARFIPIAQRWRVSSDENGIMVRPNLFRWFGLPSALVILLSGFVMLGVLQLQGRLAAPTTEGITSRDRMLTALGPIVGVMSGVLILVIVGSMLWAFGTAGSKTGALELGRDGVTVWGVPTKTKTLSWNSVRDVQPPAGAPNVTPASDLVIVGEHTSITLPLGVFPQDSAVLPDLVHYYWRNPQCRDELGTPRALARWDARDYRPV